jgi:hypothetical protein
LFVHLPAAAAGTVCLFVCLPAAAAGGAFDDSDDSEAPSSADGSAGAFVYILHILRNRMNGIALRACAASGAVRHAMALLCAAVSFC